MNNQRGFSVVDVVATLGLAGVLAAITVPMLDQAVARNRVWTAADMVATQVRLARLTAISRNETFRLRFGCPDAASLRILVVTGDAGIDDAADRCSTEQPNDRPAVYLPTGVAPSATPTLEVSGRGVFTLVGGALPTSITVGNGTTSRTITFTSTGLVTVSGE
ncbi:MAG: Tfp pilus assembly protein FimT/FimU [Vicinamibacterales bacterium]